MIRRIKDALAARKLRKEAIRTIDGIIQITHNEMLVQGVYVSDSVDEEKRAQGTICGGHKACLVGSMWLSNGVPVETRPDYDWVYKDGDPNEGEWRQVGTVIDTTQFSASPTGGRWDILFNRPSLKLAYDAVNEAADRVAHTEYAEHPNVESASTFTALDENGNPTQGWGEYFFEKVLESVEQDVVNAEIIRVCEDAQTLIKTNAVTV